MDNWEPIGDRGAGAWGNQVSPMLAEVEKGMVWRALGQWCRAKGTYPRCPLVADRGGTWFPVSLAFPLHWHQPGEGKGEKEACLTDSCMPLSAVWGGVCPSATLRPPSWLS